MLVPGRVTRDLISSDSRNIVPISSQHEPVRKSSIGHEQRRYSDTQNQSLDLVNRALLSRGGRILASTRLRTVWSIKEELLKKSQEAALTAIKVFNDPLVHLKSETYIVLMIIAWMYMLHAYYRGKGIEYRYFRTVGTRRRFDRTKHGAYKYWDLERCLNDANSPIDRESAANLRFLIGLRHEIEHQMTRSLDSYLSGRYQACALNYNAYLKQLFGGQYALDDYLTYSIQFAELSDEQLIRGTPDTDIPKKLLAYIAEFDRELSIDVLNSPRYAYRLLFTRKLVNRPGQADKVIEFIDPKSDLAKKIDKEYWIKKEVERPKFRPSDVVRLVQGAGFPKFRIQPEHVDMWRSEDAKNPGKGYGVEVQGTWYWYQSWVDRCLELCNAAGDRYR